MQPRILHVSYCWLMSSMLSTRMITVVHFHLYKHPERYHQYVLLIFFLSRCLLLSLLQFFVFTFDQFSILSDLSWIQFLSSRALATQPSLRCSEDLLSIPTIHSSKSFIKITNDTGPWGILKCHISLGWWGSIDKQSLLAVYESATDLKLLLLIQADSPHVGEVVLTSVMVVQGAALGPWLSSWVNENSQLLHFWQQKSVSSTEWLRSCREDVYKDKVPVLQLHHSVVMDSRQKSIPVHIIYFPP